MRQVNGKVTKWKQKAIKLACTFSSTSSYMAESDGGVVRLYFLVMGSLWRFCNETMIKRKSRLLFRW
ncbi:hypothetical protein FRX31_005798 [Thalictrum thalictroides]|uniref:Uncharacterized protein n=1 Tax=Thalictrum thalictroides TaxID=46969 RepID=A0A7J6X6Y8_THATH|nr:hypothetical protein FRX31_005798 [Thalictrum thalictroides]